MVFEDCPICLDEMRVADAEHPLQCERHCGFNFCRKCIESFITSSKDDYIEASDGSRQVKVWLHCPCCRSDLTYSIRDTLLLRKVDELEHYRGEGSDDVILTGAQRRLMDALERSQEVKNAVDESRRREAIYLGLPLLEEDASESSTSYEEWGVEADVYRGVHDSFRSPKALNLNVVNRPRITEKQIDTTLFSGLDFFLTADCDRIDLTELMISGDPDNLAEGAQILADVAKSIQGPRLAQQSPSSKSNSRHRYFVKHSSVYELVAEAKEAHLTEEKEKCGIFPSLPTREHGLRRKPSASGVREARRDVKRMAEHQKIFPLPVRMPKYIEIDPATRKQLRFVDDTWDGTVIDAYSKLSIGLNQRVSQRKTTHEGMRNILGGGEVRIDLPNQPRVLLASVPQEMGKQGATKCDVVTHIQERNIRGKTVAEIGLLLSQIKPDPVTGKISLVLNAENSVAEALKRRSMAMAEQSTH